MTSLIIVLIIAGIIAGLIQYFVDFRGLQLFQPPAAANSLERVTPPGYWQLIYNFFRQHWQFFGYMVIGIAGAFLVPLITQFADLKGIQDYLNCIDNDDNTECHNRNWFLLVVFGYGIVSGYSSVRIVRTLGSFLIGNITKRQQEQQKSLEEAQKQIAELKAKLAALPSTPGKNQFAAFDIAPEPQPSNDYFDEAKNETDKRLYYAAINKEDKDRLFKSLNKLVTDTHRTKLDYKPSLHLYPSVDRYKDQLLRSVYSGKSFELESLLELDAQVDRARADIISRFSSFDLTPAEHQAKINDVEELLPYNCEHVIPQSWFNRKDPMRGDLHHLFTCEIQCNGFRGNHSYFDFTDYGNDLIEENCGKVEQSGFEPENNKGAVARAALYFLLRYPGEILNGKGYDVKGIAMLIKWHKDNEVSLYEKHRNNFIYRSQGNRNPFIDLPELADKINFPVNGNLQSLNTEMATPNTGDDAAAATELNKLTGLEKCIENPGPKPWTDWRPAESLKTILKLVNALAPARKKDSDGMIGDLAHQSRDSDHNPWVWDSLAKKGIVTALDITHDPVGKCDCEKLAKSLETNKDNRIKYVIWNKQIMNSSPISGNDAWTWRPYDGTNPHAKHIHISVKCETNICDDTSPWTVTTT
jgi:endonuclease I